MQSYIDNDILSCVNTLIMQGLDVVDFKTFGYMDLESRRPLLPDAIYRMYSNTKIVTSVGAMMLYEQGRFGLDDPLSDYLPEFADLSVLRADAQSLDDLEPTRSPILMRQILSHSAGLSYGFIEPTSLVDQAYLANGVSPLGETKMTLESLCHKLAQMPLAYQPGTSWRYSFGTDVCARVIEVLSGKRFDAFLQDNIFAPLGMIDTGFYVTEEKRDRFITMYAPVDLFDPMKPGMTKADDPLTGQYTRQPEFLSGGGGLVSTVSDYLTFIRMIVNQGEWRGVRLLKPETLKLMRTNQLAEGVGVQFPMWDMAGTVFGLGLALHETLSADDPAGAANEYHWGGMAGTHSWMAPKANLTGMCMTQRMPGFWHPFSHEFKRFAYDLASAG
ncbi:MAG: serine hydrolase [Proteobacteria bacterium]|nr:serine hydrolase [Pseudomonadota bacterium]